MPAENVTVTAEFEKTAVINLPENVLSKITGITKDDESIELSSNIAAESGYYTITSNYPLVFDGADEEESDSSVTSSGNEYNYSFDLDGTQTLNVSLADLPAVTFEQQLVTGNKLTEFKYFGNSVDYNTYNDLLDGDYHMASAVPLEFVKTGENGGNIVLSDHYYAAGLYEYDFTLDYSISPVADFEVREAESSDLSLIPFTVTDYAKEKINAVSMLPDTNIGINVYAPMFDSNPPQYLQAGNYELITKDMLFISGADVVSSKYNASERVWQYEINVPETSANVLFDIKDLTRCEMTFYNADGDELDLDNLTYTGESLQPASVKVVDREYELVEGVDYEIEYDGEWVELSDEDDDIYPIVYITGLGDYGGTAGELSGWINAESFSVTLPENTEITNGVTLTDGKANYGTEIKFKVKDGYAVVGDVKNGETTLQPDTDGVYSITVTDNTEITAVIKKVYADGIGERLAGHLLSLNGNIGVNFYMELDSTVAANPNAYMRFTLPNGTTQDVTVAEAVQKNSIRQNILCIPVRNSCKGNDR